MKWILAAMVYVAIPAAAFSKESWVYADLLWLAMFFEIIYAGLLICTARESHRVGPSQRLNLLVLYADFGRTEIRRRRCSCPVMG